MLKRHIWGGAAELDSVGLAPSLLQPPHLENGSDNINSQSLEMWNVYQDVNSEHISLLDGEKYGESGSCRENSLCKSPVVRHVYVMGRERCKGLSDWTVSAEPGQVGRVQTILW